MMLKYISGLKDLFEVQPQFFTSTEPKQKVARAGLLGTRLFIVERVGTIKAGDSEKQMQYVDALNLAAVTGSIDVDDKTFQFVYPSGMPVLTPDEVAAVGAPKRDLAKFTEMMNELIPNSKLFHIPSTIKGLRVPGKEAWALIHIVKGKLHMRVSASVDSLSAAQEVPVAECGTVDGDHQFPVPLALIKKPLELNDKVAYSFYEKDGNYYFIVRSSDVVCVYSCLSFVENSGSPEIVEEVVDDQTSEESAEEEEADVTDAAEEAETIEVEVEEAEEQVDEAAEESPESGSDPELSESSDGDSGDDGTDGDAGSAEGDGDSVVDGPDDSAAAEDGEAIKPTPPDDLPLMETLDEDLKELGRRLKATVNSELAEFERMRKNIAKQVRPLAKIRDKTPDQDELKKKYEAVVSDRDALGKKLAGIRQELAPYKDLLKINWKLLD